MKKGYNNEVCYHYTTHLSTTRGQERDNATLAAWWAEIEQQRINNEWAKEITRRLEEGDRRKALFNR